MDTRIYIAAHKNFKKITDDSIYIPLHVGCEGKQTLGFTGDNTGENISKKNTNYCELTGMYWLWKNVSCDIIGLCHYRRYFLHDEKVLNKEYIEQMMKTHEMILPYSSRTKEGTVYLQYGMQHEIRDLLRCKEVIEDLCPEYADAFSWVMNANLISYANMMIAKKPIFDAYCAWLFPILFELEKRVDISQYSNYQQRVFGFLSERLIRVWVLKQNYRIKEEAAMQIDLENQ